MTFRHGAVLGKFMPAHVGHEHLIRFACGTCERVTVVVDRCPGEWPPAEIRADLLRRDLAGLPVTVVALDFDGPTPQEPEDHPRFWDVWRDLMLGAAPGADALVCSMGYGRRISEDMGCAWLPLDNRREAINLCATDIRSGVRDHWWDILPVTRSSYIHRIAFEGPESTGKSLIGRRLAKEAGVSYAPEWAECYLAQKAEAGVPSTEEDLLVIARSHVAALASIERHSQPVLIMDSTLLTTATWSRFLYGRVAPGIERLLEAEEARAPCRRLLFTPETPYVDDLHRRLDPRRDRDRFWDMLVEGADRRGMSYEVLPGGIERKQAAARRVVGESEPFHGHQTRPRPPQATRPEPEGRPDGPSMSP